MYRSFDVCSVKMVRDRSVEYEFKQIKQSDQVYEIAKGLGFEEMAEEVMGVFCINARGFVNAYFEVSRGDVTSSVSHPREVFKRAILANATAIILAHNHPSGDPTPSDEDVKATKRLHECSKMIGIELIDHIIVGDMKHVSMRSEGYICN